jgi:hypothetical protein
VVIKSFILRGTTLCRTLNMSRRFWGIWRLHIQGGRRSQPRDLWSRYQEGNFRRIWGSHSSVYEEFHLLGDCPITNPTLSLSLTLRPTVSRPIYLGIKHPSGAYDQIFIIVWQLPVCWFWAPSLTRGRVCRLQLQLTLTSAVIFGSESRRTRGHILLSHIWDFPFRRLLRLAGSRWRYSTPPPHGSIRRCSSSPAYNISARSAQRTSLFSCRFHCCVHVCWDAHVIATQPLSNMDRCLQSHYLATAVV